MFMEGVPDPEALARFKREVETLARVGGDGVVPVHEAGVERGRHYFVLGLMRGGSLRHFCLALINANEFLYVD